jgi:hypothetical protein
MIVAIEPLCSLKKGAKQLYGQERHKAAGTLAMQLLK